MVSAQYLRGPGGGGMFWPVDQKIWAGGGNDNLYPPLILTLLIRSRFCYSHEHHPSKHDARYHLLL